MSVSDSIAFMVFLVQVLSGQCLIYFFCSFLKTDILYATRVFQSQLDIENNNEDGRFIQG